MAGHHGSIRRNPRGDQLARAAAGWSDKSQDWEHKFSALPKSNKELAGWLRDTSKGEIMWKLDPNRGRTKMDLPQRLIIAREGRMEELREIIDTDVVARLLDKDGMGRTMLHVAAAAGQVEVVKMLARRSAGVAINDEETSSEEEQVDEEDEYFKWRATTVQQRLATPLLGGGAEREGEAIEAWERRGVETKGDKVQTLVLNEEEEDAMSPVAASPVGHGARHEHDEEEGGASPVTRSPVRSPVRFAEPGQARHETGKTHLGTGDSGRARPPLDGESGGGSPLKSRGKTGGRRLDTGLETWDTMLNSRDRSGDTALHLAASEGYEDVCRSLIKRRAEVEMRNLAGRSPLHLAAMNAHLGVIEMLILDAGADSRMRDREGRRPMDMTTLEEVRETLRNVAGNSAVRGGPTIFGYGDVGDRHVKANKYDPSFATHTTDKDVTSVDETSGQRMRTGHSAPAYQGVVLPRLRPQSPVAPLTPGGWLSVGKDSPLASSLRTPNPPGVKLPTKEVGWGDGGGAWQNMKELRQIRVKSSWYNFNDRHTLNYPTQTIHSRCETVGALMIGAKFHGRIKTAKYLPPE